jgi:hypothetical protein
MSDRSKTGRRSFSSDRCSSFPLTSRLRRTQYHIAVRHDGIEFAAVISQVRLISTKRLVRKIYQMDRAIFAEIVTRIRAVLPRV